MEDTLTLSIISAIFGLIGCPGDKCDTGDSSCDSGGTAADTDTDTDTDADTDVSITATWSADGVTLAITNGTGGYSFGMAETSEGGWEGEDCLEGPGPSGNSGNYDICHDGVSASGITLTTVHSLDEIVANSTTLITDTIANGGSLESIVDGTEGCYTWGGDGSYYAGLGCEAM